VSLRSAVTFLTRLPLPHTASEHPTAELGAATVYFPVVGALIGALGAGVYWLASTLWPEPLAIILAVAATVLATGALHEDALADFADGFGGGWSRDQVLAIMKDSRIGSYGVAALTLVLLAKLAALASLTRLDVVRALIAAHTIGRWAALPLLAGLPYVRDAGGTGAAFTGGVTPLRLTLATLVTAAILAATIGLRTIPTIIAATLVTAFLGWYAHRRIGGITGDVLGATTQCVELATYLVLASRYISIPG
jgi:adenosylcobinamide-GDP ribazoletransferase